MILNKKWKRGNLLNYENLSNYIYLTNSVIFSNKLYLGIFKEENFIIASLVPDGAEIIFDSTNYFEITLPPIQNFSRILAVKENKLFFAVGGRNESRDGIFIGSYDSTSWHITFIEISNIYVTDLCWDQENIYVCGNSAFLVHNTTSGTSEIYDSTTIFPLSFPEGETPDAGLLTTFSGCETLNENIILLCNIENLFWSLKERSDFEIFEGIYHFDTVRQFLVKFNPKSKVFTKFLDWKEIPYGQSLTNPINVGNKLYLVESYRPYTIYGKLWEIEEDNSFRNNIELIGHVRTFSGSHPDFGGLSADVEYGIVKSSLEKEKKPIWNPDHIPITVSNESNFNQWFRDGNRIYPVQLNFNWNPNQEIYEFNSFVRQQNKDNLYGNMIYGEDLFSNCGNEEDLFSLEIHTKFVYEGSEFFKYVGTDDFWLFIDNKLVIDLGGPHDLSWDIVYLDTLGLETGKTYDIDIFFSKRISRESIFSIYTDIKLFSSINGKAKKIMEDFYWVPSYFPREEFSDIVFLENIKNELFLTNQKSCDLVDNRGNKIGYNLQVFARQAKEEEQKNYLFDTILYSNSEISSETEKYSYENNYIEYTIPQPNPLGDANIVNKRGNSFIHNAVFFNSRIQNILSHSDNFYVCLTDRDTNFLCLGYTENLPCEWTKVNLKFKYKITSSIRFQDKLFFGGISLNNDNVILCYTGDIREEKNKIFFNLQDREIQNDDFSRTSNFYIFDNNLYFASGTLFYRFVDGTSWELILNLNEDSPSEVWEGVPISTMCAHNGKLYLGGCSLISYQDGIFNFFNLISDFLDESNQGITSLCSYDGKLYIGLTNLSSGQGYLYAFDGTNFTLVCSAAEFRLSNNNIEDTRNVPLISQIVDLKTKKINETDVLLILESHFYKDLNRVGSRLLYFDSQFVYELAAFPRDLLSKIEIIEEDVLLLGHGSGYETIWYVDLEEWVISKIFSGRSYRIIHTLNDFYDSENIYHLFTISNSISLNFSFSKTNICLHEKKRIIRAFPLPSEFIIGYPNKRGYPVIK